MSGLSSRIAARCAQLTARRCISLPILRNSSSFRSAPGLIVQKRFLASAKPLNASATGSDCVDSHIEETQVSTEIKDADLIFKNVWSSLVAKYGEEHLNFPQDILWLSGAPGAGKGVMQKFIMSERGIIANPIETSSILTSPEAKALKASGQLVGDRTVVQLMFEQLLNPKYRSGCIVDGFPRTPTQAECMKLLYDKMRAMHDEYHSTELRDKFPRPIFHVMVLFIEEDISVERQLLRGRQVISHNRQVELTGVGSLEPVRATDSDPVLARQRYQQFKEHVFGSLSVVKEKFHFHFIDATGSVTDVQNRIRKEIAYQSSMELDETTFAIVRKLPLATELISNARHALVCRLDEYARHQAVLFQDVIKIFEKDFLHIISRQALAGRAIIRSQNPIFRQPAAVNMLLDVLSERGFSVVLDVLRESVPSQIDLQTGKIINETIRVYKFEVQFERPKIRRG